MLANYKGVNAFKEMSLLLYVPCSSYQNVPQWWGKTCWRDSLFLSLKFAVITFDSRAVSLISRKDLNKHGKFNRLNDNFLENFLPPMSETEQNVILEDLI